MTAQLSTFPTSPGLHFDVPEDVYHRAFEFLSSTGARTLAHRTPAHFAWQQTHPRKPKTTFDIGTAAHALLLGKGADVVVLEHATFNTKAAREDRDAAYAAGKVPLLAHQRDEVDDMVAAVRADPVAGKLFARDDCHAEVTVVGQDPETGVWCRARTDWLLPVVDGEPITFVDLKTSADDVDEFHLAASVSKWSYHQQIDHYSDCLRWALDLDPEYPVGAVLVAVEKDPDGPHLVNIGGPDDDALHYAHEDNRKARHRFARYSAAGHWPGHQRPGDQPLALSLPSWRIYQYERQYPSGEYDPDLDFEFTEDDET